MIKVSKDFDGKNIGIKRLCRCGKVDVSYSDFVYINNDAVFVHGVLHCYSYGI